MMAAKQRPFRIRTITAFITLQPDDFFIGVEGKDGGGVASKIEQCNFILRMLETKLIDIGYEVQTVRIATNPFREWLMNTSDNEDEQSTKKYNAENMNTMDVIQKRLNLLDQLLSEHNIDFCSLGPSMDIQHTISICPMIVNTSKRLSCSANINAGDVNSAQAAARCILTISTLDKHHHPNTANNDSGDHVKGGLGNFRFCASSCVTTVPFFPAAKTPPITNSDVTSNTADNISFAIGLENGRFARQLLEEANTIGNIKHIFHTKMRSELLPIQEACTTFASIHNCQGGGAPSPPSSSSSTRHIPTNTIVKYLGIDTSLNPSLDIDGSIASAIECLNEVQNSTFGRSGTLAAAAAITMSLQSLPDIVTTGYCGLMLPVLEDRRLAELGMMGMDGTSCSSNSYPTNHDERLTINKLLCISSVCGVGVDTVPVPGNVSQDDLTSLILDVAALAGRWNKALSVRVFPVPEVKAGEMTTFDSPYMCNSRIFNL